MGVIIKQLRCTCLLDVDPLVVPLELGHKPDHARVDAKVERLVASGVSGSDRGGYDRLFLSTQEHRDTREREASKPSARVIHGRVDREQLG